MPLAVALSALLLHVLPAGNLAAPATGRTAPAALFIASEKPVHQLAAHELRRYLHLSSSSGLGAFELGRGASAPHGVVLVTTEAWRQQLPELVASDTLDRSSISRIARLAAGLRSGSEDHALLPAETAAGRYIIVVLGATDRSVLAGTYSLVERLTPVRFQLHGDILPDRTGPLLALGELFRAGHASLGGGVVLSPGEVSVRGLQPFHDFAEGPDWWNAAEYKLLFDQMAKMKLNMIALHNYGEWLVQPTVWTGLEEDFDHTTGRLKKNGTYGATYITTANGATWGGNPMNISSYLFGAQTAFASDCYGSDAMRLAGNCPDPALPPSSSARARVGAFDAVAEMLTDAFSWGRLIGVQSCVGIEACDGTPNCANPKGDADPAQYPGDKTAALKDYFRGALLHINRTYGSEIFWLWTGEGWAPRTNSTMPMSDPAIQGVVEGFRALHEAREETGLQIALATSGWTFGPLANRAYFDTVLPPDVIMSSINEKIGLQNVELAYTNVTTHGRPAWSIPWLEDDSAMTGVQLWANRTLVFAADAVRVGGATGLLGIHWRTTDVAAQATALAQWPWQRTLTSQELYQDLVAAEFGLPATSDLTLRIAGIFSSIDSFGSSIEGALAPPRPGVEVNTPGWPGYDPSAKLTRTNAFVSETQIAIPRPIVWGPGRLDNTFQIEPSTFRFVNDFASLRTAVAMATKSAPVPLARFDRWVATFQYLRAAGQVGDVWRRIAVAMGDAVRVIRSGDENTFRGIWNESLVPLRAELINRTSAMVTHLTETISDTGSLGALANTQQYTLPMLTRSTDLAYKALYGARCKPAQVKCYDEHTSRGRVFPYIPGGGGGEYTPGSCSDTLTDERCANVAHMSHEWCAMICHAADATYKFAAVEGKGGNQCRCAKSIPPSAQTRPLSECGTPCAGENGTVCGGDWRAAGFAFTCTSGEVPPPPLTPELRWESYRNQRYIGTERLVVMTPRGRLGMDETHLPIQAIAFVTTAFVSEPTVMVRAMGSSVDFQKVPMRQAAVGRGVWYAQIEVTTGRSLEYFVVATTEQSPQLSWPAGGAANAHTVLVVPSW